jgi:hypothetical protein
MSLSSRIPTNRPQHTLFHFLSPTHPHPPQKSTAGVMSPRNPTPIESLTLPLKPESLE